MVNEIQSAANSVSVKPSNQKLLSIIIPAFNEGEQISMILDETNRVLKKLRTSYQIIVIDDGSIDNTSLVAEEHGADIVIRNEHSIGKGAAIQLGASKASGSIIITMDADGAYSPKEIASLIEPILREEADLVIGSRYHVYFKKLHFFGIWLLKLFNLVYFQMEIVDMWSGFKAYRASLFHDLIRTRLSLGYQFEPEVIVLAKERGYRVVEIDVWTRLRESFGHSRAKWARERGLIGSILSILRIFLGIRVR